MESLTKFICKYCNNEYKNIQQLKKHISFNRCSKIKDNTEITIDYLDELNNAIKSENNIKNYIQALEEKNGFLTNQLNLLQFKNDELQIYKDNFDEILDKINKINVEKEKKEKDLEDIKEKYETLNTSFLHLKAEQIAISKELKKYKQIEEEAEKENYDKNKKIIESKQSFMPLTTDCLNSNLDNLTADIIAKTCDGIGYFIFTCLLNADKTKIKYSFKNIKKYEGKYLDETGAEIHDKKFNYFHLIWFPIIKNKINDIIIENSDHKDIDKIKQFYKHAFVDDSEALRNKIFKQVQNRIAEFPKITEF